MGSVVISLDAELAWGFHHLAELPEELLQRTRRVWTELCQLFDAYDVPTTWAVTGHLLRNSCEVPHHEHPAGERICETATDRLLAQELWFDDGLIDVIADAEVDHEIASHGFTHVHMAHERMNREFADREIAAAAESLADRDFDTSSFVFPVNKIGHIDLLAEHGFDCYRGVNSAREGNSTIRRLAKLGSSTVGRPTPPMAEPHVDEHGLVNVPASLYLFNFEGVLRSILSRIGTDPVVRQAMAGIDYAAKSDGVFHMWLHPHNVRRPEDTERIVSILKYVARRRRTDDLRVETMGDVASRVKIDNDPQRS